MDVHGIDIINVCSAANDLEIKKWCFIIAQDVKSGRLLIVQFIARLKNLLLHSSPSKRVVGVLILTEVLKNFSADFLDDHQLKIISVFYVEKLCDNQQVLPAALRGILAITTFRHFPGEVVPSIVNTLFQSVACQQQQQVDRHIIYNIFQILLEKNKEELLSMGLDFVYGIISSIDGERDPRNLLLLFKWLKTFLRTVSLSHLTEEMFEVIACYFPVDFKSPSEANSVSREDLADALCPCLCAIPEFAEYCIPLALEKLDSSQKTAKTDSMNLLIEGCLTFPIQTYIKYFLEIWSRIEKEVFSGTDDKVKLKCLRTLSTVINKISLSKEGLSKSVMKDMCISVRGNLFPDSKLFEISSNLLLHIALACQESAEFMVKEIVPLLTNTYSITSASDKKAVILKSLIEFTKAYLSQHNEVDLTKIEELDAITAFCLNALTEEETVLRIIGLDGLSEIANYLSPDIRRSLYRSLSQILIEPLNEDVRSTALKCFKNLSLVYPDEINDYILCQTKLSDPFSLDLYLDALGVIANLNNFRDNVSDILLSYAISSIDLATVASKNIRSLLEPVPNNSELLAIFIEKEAVSKLIQYVLVQDVVNEGFNSELLFHISVVLKCLMDFQEYEIQNQITTHQLNLITSCNELSEEAYLFLLDGLLSRLCKNVPLDATVIFQLTRISICHNHCLVKNTATKLLANLVNKQSNDEELHKWLTIIKEHCLQNISSCGLNVVDTLSWVTKGLVMRNHFEGNAWVKVLLDMLEQNNFVARGFRIIMNDDFDPLSFHNKAILYRHKFFLCVTNKLSMHYESGKLSYLMAVGYLFENAPEQSILLQLRKVIKLVLLCLEKCIDPEVLCIILSKIKKIINNNDPIIQENLENILLRILNLSTIEFSMKVRIEALQCLVGFTTLPLHQILYFKQKVLNQLRLCIDDKKRLVRKEAMDARSAWFLVDN